MRVRSSLVILSALVLLAGCAPEPASSPSPSESNTSSPTAAPTPSPSPSETPDPPVTGTEFTTSVLVELCTEKTRSLAPNATYYADMATTEWLASSALWFVVIPKTLDGADSVAVCGIGGTQEAPVFALEGESLPGGVADIREELLTGAPGSES
ncbi:hypothetical protein ACFVWL_01845 [Microbacterium sp. NPDC058269]|uniref:hypothetical protein n=1 Tax=Microbacterium sp. NPDC058269 TaxID=3346414 RepID=UPI0036D9F815